MTVNKIDCVLGSETRLGARRATSHRQNLMMATLLVPLGATVMLAATKTLLRHTRAEAPMLVEVASFLTVPVSDAGTKSVVPARVALRPTGTRVALAPALTLGEAIAPVPPQVVRSLAFDEPSRARAMNEARLRRDPTDIDARSALIVAALAAGQIERAHTMARQALHESPSEPKAWIVSARLAKAEGNAELARHELTRARDLRMQQLGYSDNGDDDSTLPAVTLAPGGEQYQGRAIPNQPRWTPPGSQFAQADIDLAEPPSLHPTTPFGSPTPLAPLRTATGARLDTGPTDLSPPTAMDSGDRAPVTPARRMVEATAPAEMTAGGQSGLAASAGNPFRVAQIGGLSSGDSLAPAGGSGIVDPMTQQIDREIAALNGQIDPAVQAGFGFRVRSGTIGLSQLTDLSAPLEGEFSPGGYGRLKVSVTPTFLMAGKLGAGNANQQQFGTGAFGGTTVGNQTAQGTALNVGYAFDDVTTDVGSTPLGFPIANVVGGVQWAPKLSDNIGLRIIGERRAITDSVLSFAGARDAATGTDWGGVTRTRGRINLEANMGQTNFYVGAGGGVLTGTHVQRNSEIEAGAGMSTPVYKTDTQEVRIGLDFAYLGYDKNLGSFTLGQGGYFSPQQFFAAVVPITYREKVSEDLSYEVGGSVGIQNVRSRSSLYYPINPDLQANLVAQISNPGSALFGGSAIHSASHTTGIAGGAHALIDYRVTPSLHVGGKVAVEHVGDYTEGSGLVYARYTFNQSGRVQ